MFEIGFSEILLIAFIALLVLGPEKLPKLAAQIGRWTGRARNMARQLRMQLEQEISYEELKKEKERAEAELRAAQTAMNKPFAAEPSSTPTPSNITPPTHSEPEAPTLAAPEPKTVPLPTVEPEANATIHQPAGSRTGAAP